MKPGRCGCRAWLRNRPSLAANRRRAAPGQHQIDRQCNRGNQEKKLPAYVRGGRFAGMISGEPVQCHEDWILGNKPSPFQLLIDPAEALAAAKRLRSHLPPYSSVLPMSAEDEEAERSP